MRDCYVSRVILQDAQKTLDKLQQVGERIEPKEDKIAGKLDDFKSQNVAMRILEHVFLILKQNKG